MKKRIFVLIVCALFFIMLYAGCGNSAPADYKSESYAPEEDMFEEAYDGYTSDYSKEEASSDSEGNNRESTDLKNRKLIETVNLTIQTKFFDKFESELTAAVKSMGGYVEYSSVNSYEDSNRSGDYTLRIPADKLDEFLNQISENGTVTYKSNSVEDVTLTYVDMQSHVKALRAEEETLLRMLETAESMEDIIIIQDRLTDIRYEVESFESRLRTYDNLIDYATVQLTLREVEREATLVDHPSVWNEIANNLSDSLYGIGRFFRGVFVFLVSSIPVMLVIAAINVPIIIFAIVLPIKRKKKKMALKAEQEAASQAAVQQ